MCAFNAINPVNPRLKHLVTQDAPINNISCFSFLSTDNFPRIILNFNLIVKIIYRDFLRFYLYDS